MKKILLKLIENEINASIPEPSENFLYHGTNIKNLNSIKKYGLIPDYGDVVKSTEMYQMYMDDDYIDENDRVEGVLFFSDNPDVWTYSQYGQKDKDIYKSILVIVEKNKTIYKKVKGGHFIDINGKRVESVDYIDIDKLPFFIENGDYFSFQEQEPFDILYGERLIEFLKKK